MRSERIVIYVISCNLYAHKIIFNDINGVCHVVYVVYVIWAISILLVVNEGGISGPRREEEQSRQEVKIYIDIYIYTYNYTLSLLTTLLTTAMFMGFRIEMGQFTVITWITWHTLLILLRITKDYKRLR